MTPSLQEMLLVAIIITQFVASCIATTGSESIGRSSSRETRIIFPFLQESSRPKRYDQHCSLQSAIRQEKLLDDDDFFPCSSSQVTELFDGYIDQSSIPPFDDKDSLDYNIDSGIDQSGTLAGKPSHSPVVYRYYGRSRPPAHSMKSVPFLLIGPNVDHWKAVGKLLAARGFTAMACERVEAEEGDESTSIDPEEEGRSLVLAVLDALRWNKAILIGCDKESALAIDSAMHLAPERVAGLILCGDLSSAESLIAEADVDSIDSFLQLSLACPFMIIWDGENKSTRSDPLIPGGTDPSLFSSDRCLILGGGSAPHRLRPEQFAWVLTRFVEENLAPYGRRYQVGSDRARRLQGVRTRAGDQDRAKVFSALQLPFGLGAVVSSEGRLLIGRFIATALFYGAMMRVLVVQYGLLCTGLRSIKSRYDSVGAIGIRIFQAVGMFFKNYCYIPRLFKLKRASDDDDDDVIEMKGEDNAENDISCESKDKTDSKHDDEPSYDYSETEGQNESSPLEEEKKSFKPFFFLDQVIT